MCSPASTKKPPEAIIFRASFVYNYLAVRVHLLSKITLAALQEVLNILICSQLQRRSQECLMPTSALQAGCALVKHV